MLVWRKARSARIVAGPLSRTAHVPALGHLIADRYGEYSHEQAHFPAEQSPPQPYPRFPQPHAHPRRQGHYCCPPTQGPCRAVCLISFRAARRATSEGSRRFPGVLSRGRQSCGGNSRRARTSPQPHESTRSHPGGFCCVQEGGQRRSEKPRQASPATHRSGAHLPIPHRRGDSGPAFDYGRGPHAT